MSHKREMPLGVHGTNVPGHEAVVLKSGAIVDKLASYEINRLIIGEAYDEHFEILGCYVGGKEIKLDDPTPGGEGAVQRRISVILVPGETIALRVRNRTTEPKDFHAAFIGLGTVSD